MGAPWFFLTRLGQIPWEKSHKRLSKDGPLDTGVPEPYEILVQSSKRRTRPTEPQLQRQGHLVPTWVSYKYSRLCLTPRKEPFADPKILRPRKRLPCQAQTTTTSARERRVFCFTLKGADILLLIQKGNVLRANSKCS